jgi:hypothetical protein
LPWVPISADAIQLVYKTPDGTLKDRLLGRQDEENIALATRERPWSFDGDGDAFKLAIEAKRIDLAFLFDPMMAVHTSNVEPLPHQITAVYESMLPRQPLRFVLADDPGAGKTIMAGLYISGCLILFELHPTIERVCLDNELVIATWYGGVVSPSPQRQPPGRNYRIGSSRRVRWLLAEFWKTSRNGYWRRKVCFRRGRSKGFTSSSTWPRKKKEGLPLLR